MAKAQFVAGGSSALTGTDAFNRALREMDRNLYREFRRGASAIGRMVAARAKSKAASYSRQAAAAAAAISAAALGGGTALKLSGSKVPFAIGAEYGAHRYPQFPPWTGNQWSGMPENIGYFFHPAIVESRDEVLDLYMAAARLAASKAGLSMTGPGSATHLDVALGQAGI